jgi:hypothetical protein
MDAAPDDTAPDHTVPEETPPVETQLEETQPEENPPEENPPEENPPEETPPGGLGLDLPTGRLILGDPGELFGDARPLGVALPAGRFPVVAGPDAVRLVLSGGEPVRWGAVPGFATPSGHLCLLDAAALEGFTDLGDEPVDEYELLAERFAERPGAAVEFSGLLVLPAGPEVRAVLLGFGGDGRIRQIVAQIGDCAPMS